LRGLRSLGGIDDDDRRRRNSDSHRNALKRLSNEYFEVQSVSDPVKANDYSHFLIEVNSDCPGLHRCFLYLLDAHYKSWQKLPQPAVARKLTFTGCKDNSKPVEELLPRILKSPCAKMFDSISLEDISLHDQEALQTTQMSSNVLVDALQTFSEAGSHNRSISLSIKSMPLLTHCFSICIARLLQRGSIRELRLRMTKLCGDGSIIRGGLDSFGETSRGLEEFSYEGQEDVSLSTVVGGLGSQVQLRKMTIVAERADPNQFHGVDIVRNACSSLCSLQRLRQLKLHIPKQKKLSESLPVELYRSFFQIVANTKSLRDIDIQIEDATSETMLVLLDKATSPGSRVESLQLSCEEDDDSLGCFWELLEAKARNFAANALEPRSQVPILRQLYLKTSTNGDVFKAKQEIILQLISTAVPGLCNFRWNGDFNCCCYTQNELSGYGPEPNDRWSLERFAFGSRLELWFWRNRAGRALLSAEDVPAALWPRVLYASSREKDTLPGFPGPSPFHDEQPPTYLDGLFFLVQGLSGKLDFGFGVGPDP